MSTTSKTVGGITPMMDIIFVRRLDPEAVSKGGIVIPDVAKERRCQGIAVAVGPGRYDNTGTRVPMEVQPGDQVLVGRYDGREVEYDGEKLLVVREADILGIYED